MENNNDYNEMRSQIEMLKKALDNEKIVNERLIRSAIGTKVKSLVRPYMLNMVIVVIMIPYCGYILTQLTDNSTAFIIVTELFMLTGLVFYWRVHRNISAKAIANGDLISIGRKLTNLKRMTTRWQLFAIPFVFVWLAWFLWENLAYCDISWAGIAGCAIGLAAGLVMSVYQQRRQHMTINELIKQIDELAKN